MDNWAGSGVPDKPRAWLVATARNRAIDRLRRDRAIDKKSDTIKFLEEDRRGVGEAEFAQADGSQVDERLQLMFLCCHPALSQEAQVALTLRTLGGLTTDEIARGFLVSEATMAQRIVRAKRKIRAANIPLQIPGKDRIEGCLSSLLSILYLIFNEGYVARSGIAVTRADLCFEAIRLAKVVCDLVPDHTEAMGLLALMLLHDSRRRARMDAGGTMIALEDQDRSLWRQDQIERGDRILRAALGLGAIGPYQIQAAISGVHAHARDFASTDWKEIQGLYQRLHALTPTPVVALNQAYAMSMTEGPMPALEIVEVIAADPAMNTYQPLHAMRADLLFRLGRHAEAAKHWDRAIALTQNEAERKFLRARRDYSPRSRVKGL